MRIHVGLLAVSLLALGTDGAHASTTSFVLVQAHAPCTSPNGVHEAPLGGLACTPPVPLSSYRLVKPGSLRLTGSTSSVRVQVSLPRVDDATGTPVGFFPPYVGVVFTARVILRNTEAECSDGSACTVADRAMAVPLLCLGGRCKGSVRVDIGRVVGSRSVQTGAIEILDDLGNVLASPGL